MDPPLTTVAFLQEIHIGLWCLHVRQLKMIMFFIKKYIDR